MTIVLALFSVVMDSVAQTKSAVSVSITEGSFLIHDSIQINYTQKNN